MGCTQMKQEKAFGQKNGHEKFFGCWEAKNEPKIAKNDLQKEKFLKKLKNKGQNFHYGGIS